MISILLLAAAMMAGDSVEVAEPFPAVSVTGIDNVCEGAAHWTGPDDLSFDYSLRQDGNELVIDMNVTDDDVREGDAVEVYLMDAALMEEVLEGERRLEGLVRSCPKSSGLYEIALRQSRNFALDSYATKFLFVLSQGELEETASGFRLNVALPIANDLSSKEQAVTAVGFNITVVDTDTDGDLATCTCMRSSPILADRGLRLAKYELSASIDMDIPEDVLWYQQLNGNGFSFDAAEGYRYFTPKYLGWSGDHEVESDFVPMGFEPIPIQTIFADDQFSLCAYQDKLFIDWGDDKDLLESDEDIHAKSEWVYSVIWSGRHGAEAYILFQAVGWSRSIPGMGNCGAGRELDLLYLSLDIGSRRCQLQGERIESCYGVIPNLPSVPDGRDRELELKEGVLELVVHQGGSIERDHPYERHIHFDAAYPEARLKAMDTPNVDLETFFDSHDPP